MSAASRTAWDSTLSKDSLQYGGFNVTGDWKAVQGNNQMTYYNPNNASENFTLNYGGSNGDISQNEELNTYLSYRNQYAKAPSYNLTANNYLSDYSTAAQLGLFSAGTDGQYKATNLLQGSLGDGSSIQTLGQIAANQNQQLPQSGYQTVYDQTAAQKAAATKDMATKAVTQAQALTSTPGLQMSDFSAADKAMNADQIAARALQLVPTTPVKVNPSTTTKAVAGGTPKTVADVNSLIASNRAKLLGTIQQTAAEQSLMQQQATLQDQARSTQLSAQAGINQSSNRVVPMQAIIGEQNKIQQQANLALQTLSAQEDTVTKQLQIEQTKRQALQDMYKLQLQFNMDDQDMLMKLADQTKVEQGQAKDFALQNGIKSPFYTVSGTIYRTADGKAYSTPEAFFADGGAKDFSNAPQISAAPPDKLLSVAEAKSLGVPYGTTQSQAMGITPSAGRASSTSHSSPAPKSNNNSSIPTSSAAIKKWMQANKDANPNVPYYDLWGQLADELRAQKLNPADYDKEFWTVLSPEGLAGYQAQHSNSQIP